MLFRRNTPPEDERKVKAARRLDTLEAEVESTVRAATSALEERSRLADAVDDTARTLRQRRERRGHQV